MVLYYITDRTQFAGDEQTRCLTLLGKIHEAAHAGVDFIQLREKDLSGHTLELLACEAAAAVRGTKARLLLNSRSDIAMACGAHGVHLRSGDISVEDARLIAKNTLHWLVSVSCHSAPEIKQAKGADFAVFAPVFAKKGAQPQGLESLREACRIGVPVLALGGITIANAGSCVEAGAAGIAGIRLFQENSVAEVVRTLS